jgi:hypothetical protein
MTNEEARSAVASAVGKMVGKIHRSEKGSLVEVCTDHVYDGHAELRVYVAGDLLYQGQLGENDQLKIELTDG